MELLPGPRSAPLSDYLQARLLLNDMKSMDAEVTRTAHLRLQAGSVLLKEAADVCR
jgi:hypothetical protein